MHVHMLTQIIRAPWLSQIIRLSAWPVCVPVAGHGHVLRFAAALAMHMAMVARANLMLATP